jgi:YVTN family beta-propeller protein
VTNSSHPVRGYSSGRHLGLGRFGRSSLLVVFACALMLGGSFAVILHPKSPHEAIPSIPGEQGRGDSVRALSGVAAEPSHPSSLAAGWTPTGGSSWRPHYGLFGLSRVSAACPSIYSSAPAWLAYDPTNATMWVASPPSCVDEITPATTGFGWNLTAAVVVGTDPFGVAVDNATNEIFVSNTGSDNVTVINASTATQIASIAVGSTPYGVAFDWASNEVYVANGGSDNLSVISGSNLTVVGSVGVGSSPVGVVADPQSRQVFVANRGSANVSVVSDRNHAVVATVSAGDQPYGVALDNRTGAIYVTNENSSNLSVLNGSSDALEVTIPVLSPGIELQGVAYDWETGLLWVGAGRSVAVVINATTETVIGYANLDPSGVAFDSSNGNVCVTNTANETFECLTFNFYYGTAPVAFNESGLPGGTTWGVTANGSYPPNTTTQWSTGAEIDFGAYPEYSPQTLYSYRIDTPLGYGATPATGVFNAGSSLYGPIQVTINVTFTELHGVYPVSFQETGLPSGTTWSTELNGTWSRTNSTADRFLMPNGSYAFAVGQTAQYVPSPSSGSVTVHGAAVNVSITYTTPPTYLVSFVEHGLASGTYWDVWLGGATNASRSSVVYFHMTNGTYAFVAHAAGYVTGDSPGNLMVNGSAVSRTINFTVAPYTVAFQETGLPVGTVFSVTCNGLPVSGVSTIPFSEPNGTFPFSVGGVAGLVPTPSSGNVTVNGANVTVAIIFAAPFHASRYVVSLTETGLPAGTSWSVTLNGSTRSANGSRIAFTELNGTFDCSVAAVAGFTASFPTTVVVAGANLTVPVDFAPVRFALTFHETGLPTGTGWGVVIGDAVQSSLTDNVTFQEPNGRYGYVILAVTGYVTTYSGFASVNGSDTLVRVPFHATTYPIVFVEFGLPSGTNWSVTATNASLNFNETQNSTTNSIVLFLPNGTYTISFTVPAGFAGAPGSTQITVAGRGTDGPGLSVHSTEKNPGEPGIASFELLAIAAVAILAIGLVTWAAWRRRRPPRPPRDCS